MKTITDKINQSYGVKTVSVKLEDVDEGNRIVKGYLSSFNTLDSDLDVIRKGAFAKSLQENGVNSNGNRKIAHLRNHDWDWQIGKFIELEEDEFGLKFVSQLGRSTKGNDALLDYQDGILREHSIGFNYVQDKIKFIEDSTLNEGGHFEITEVKIWEGSGVTFGSNSLTPVLEAAKSTGDNSKLIEKITEMEDSFLKAIKNGKGTDERLESLEVRFKQIQELRNSLIIKQPSIKDTVINNEPNDTNQKKELLLKLINI